MLRLFVFTVFLLCLFGCGEGTRQASNFTTSEIESLHLDSTKLLCADVSAVKRVNLNSFLGDKEFEFGDKVQSLHFIPLETTDDGLLANIYKVVLTDDYIYVHDAFKGGGLAIFTSKGKFVRRISHGEDRVNFTGCRTWHLIASRTVYWLISILSCCFIPLTGNIWSRRKYRSVSIISIPCPVAMYSRR